MLHSLDQVIVAVRDLDAATRTYEALLGRPPSWRSAQPSLGTESSLFRLDNTCLELLAPLAASAPSGPLALRLSQSGEGLLGFAFGTDDADETANELRARGVSASDPVPSTERDPAHAQERAWKSVFVTTAASRGPFVFAIEQLSAVDALPRVEPNVRPDSELYALDHVVVSTRDAEATRAFYGEQLGLRLALDRSFPSRGLRLIFFRIGGVTVEIAARLAAPVVPEASDELMGLAWRVRDAELARERLMASGARVTAVRDGHKPGTRVCTVETETYGIATLLIEPGEKR